MAEASGGFRGADGGQLPPLHDENSATAPLHVLNAAKHIN